MKRRPIEIPYIPKHRRGSRYAPREGGKILRSKKGVEALRATDASAKRGKKKVDGCGCLFFLMVGLFAFSDQIWDIASELRDAYRARVETAALPPPVQAPPTTIVFEEGVAQAPRGDVRGIFTTDDYPLDSLRDEEQGTVRATLAIDVDGIPSACEVVQSSGFARLDEVTCRLLLERTRFAPALDANGEPVEGVYTTPPIRWEIPSR